MLDDRAEMYCLMRYILDQHPSETPAQYAIGLQSPDDYPGVYEWRSGGQSTPAFTNWAAGAPTDLRQGRLF